MDNLAVMTVFWTGFFICVSVILTIIGQVIVKRFDISLNRKTQKKKEMDIYYPLLVCLYDMDKRITSIFNNMHEDWLSADIIEKIQAKKGFAENPTDNSGYFFISLMFRFGRFFGILKVIETIKGNELKSSKKKKWWKHKKNNDKSDIIDNYIHIDKYIDRVTSLFQNKFFFDECYKKVSWYERGNTKDGAEIHTLVQDTIGEMMVTDTGNNYRLKTFKEFCDAYTDQKDNTFKIWFSYIEQYLLDLKLEKNEKTIEAKCQQINDVRPLRLKAIQYWCRKLIISIKQNYPDFEIQFKDNPDVDDSFFADGKTSLYISPELANTIKNYVPPHK